MTPGERVRDHLTLTRPGIVATVVVTAATGYLTAASRFEPSRLVLVLSGISLLVAGANAANQILERSHDACMRRTRERPLAAGRLSVRNATVLAFALSLGGLAALWRLGPLPFSLGLAALVLYVGVYTPLKRLTPLSLFVGAVPGALPPLIGATAASEGQPGAGLALFLLLFLWQIPHFLAIGWLHREDYLRGGFRVLSAGDRTGRLSALLALGFAAVLPLLLWLPGSQGTIGAEAALLSLPVGLVFVVHAVRFERDRTRLRARSLFLASNVFLLSILVVAAGSATGRLAGIS